MASYEEKVKELNKLLPECAQNYVDYCIGSLNRSFRTIEGYEYDLLSFFDFLMKIDDSLTSCQDITVKYLDTLTPRIIQQYMSHIREYDDNGVKRSNRASSRARKLSAIRSFFKYLYTFDSLKQNPAKDVEPPHIHSKKGNMLDSKEMSAMIHNVTNTEGIPETQYEYAKRSVMRDTAIITMLAYSGIRVSELCNLDIDDIDFDHKLMTVTRKGGNGDTVVINDKIISALQDYFDCERYDIDSGNRALFLSSRKEPTRLTPRSVERIVSKWGKSVGLMKVTPHSLRRTFGTSLYNSSGDIYLVAEALGHKNIQVTKDHYTTMKSERRDAIRSLNYDSE